MNENKNTEEEMIEAIDIEVGDADIGPLNLIICIITPIICLVYFFTHITAP